MEEEKTKKPEAKIVIISGPTGAGKSQLALKLAQSIDGEIIVADSMQIYRYMDIGTAKPTPEERALVPHHLVDVIDPDESFSAARFRDMARKAINSIQKKGKKALVCGGTGLYIKALIRGLFSGPGENKKLRQDLRAQEAKYGEGYLYEKLKKVDPPSALRIHPKDTFRIIRALEIYYLTGLPASFHYSQHAFQDNQYEYLQISIQWERDILYDRIDKRCDQMIANGFIDEVKSLLDRGYHSGLKSMQSLGYRHLCSYLEGHTTLKEAIRTMKRDTRHYAKRQLTWLRADPSIVWVNNPLDSFDYIERLIKKFLFSSFPNGRKN